MSSKFKGFTLIELLVVIAIMSIMAAIAMPNFNNWVAKQRIGSSTQQVANMLNFARAEAVRRNVPVYVCPATIRKDGKEQMTNGEKCGDMPKSTDNLGGLVAWADTNKNGAYDNNADSMLRVVALNDTGTKRIDHSFNTFSYGGTKKTEELSAPLVYLPNGQFRLGENINAGYLRLYLTDATASSAGVKASRSSTLLVANNGRVISCDNKDKISKLDLESICEGKASKSS